MDCLTNCLIVGTVSSERTFGASKGRTAIRLWAVSRIYGADTI